MWMLDGGCEKVDGMKGEREGRRERGREGEREGGREGGRERGKGKERKSTLRGSEEREHHFSVHHSTLEHMLP